MTDRAILIAVSAMLLASCAVPFRAPVIPPRAAVFERTTIPLTTDFHGQGLGSKVGKARTWWVKEPIFGIPVYSGGEASIEAAARAGGITEVTHADLRILNIIGSYFELEVTVYGR